MTGKTQVAFLAMLFFSSCNPLVPPAEPNRNFMLQVNFVVDRQIAADSVDICIEIKKGRVEDHFIVEPVKGCQRVKPGDSFSDLISAFGFLGDPRRRKNSTSEIVALPLNIRIESAGKLLWKTQLKAESYAGITIPAKGLIPLNDFGILGNDTSGKLINESR